MSRKKAAAADADAYEQLARRLVEQLADLRAQFQEAVASYSVRVQGELAEIGDALTSEDPRTLSTAERAARATALRDALARVMSLSLKPAKGRRRDLKAVQVLAEDLGGVLAEW